MMSVKDKNSLDLKLEIILFIIASVSIFFFALIVMRALKEQLPVLGSDQVSDKFKSKPPKKPPVVSTRHIDDLLGLGDVDFHTACTKVQNHVNMDVSALNTILFDAPQFEVFWEKQKGLCCYCKAPMCRKIGFRNTATWDHIIPRSKGGKKRPNNLALACSACNQAKGSKSEEEFRRQFGDDSDGVVEKRK